MSDYNFSRAMFSVLHGGRMRRSDWHRPAYIEIQIHGRITAVVMVMNDGSLNAYTPSQCDMLARDWGIVVNTSKPEPGAVRLSNL
jgi:hypothetical protein